MSIFETLKKIVDPEQARLEELDRETARKIEQERQEKGGSEPTYRCRICAATSTKKSTFCLKCLAETMEPVDE